MPRTFRRLLPIALLILSLLPFPAAAQFAPFQNCDPVATQPIGAEYITCVPGSWNGDLVIVAGPYVAPTQPVGFPDEGDELVEQIEDALGLLGYAVAITSFRDTGLVVQDGVADLVELVGLFEARYEAPGRTFLVGVSEGGLIATLGVEREPDVFDAGLAACGPYGDFQQQTNYFGDFRVLFDVYFPGLMPASPVDIPAALIDETAWNEKFASDIRPALTDPANADALDNLFAVSDAPFEPGDDLGLSSQISVTERLLWYNVFATNDARAKLGGQPFGNAERVYSGMGDAASDAALNEEVARFPADITATQAISTLYETSGNLAAPLVTLHTMRDPIVPNFHLAAYTAKVEANGRGDYLEPMSVEAFGHCNFATTDLFNAFNRMVTLANTLPPDEAEREAGVLYLPLVSGE